MKERQWPKTIIIIFRYGYFASYRKNYDGNLLFVMLEEHDHDTI
jgi:hypothetical protein